jgi:hypothetical protein
LPTFDLVSINVGTAGLVCVMVQRGTLRDLAATIYPYPTVLEGFRRAGDACRRQALPMPLRRILFRSFDWTR